MKEFRGAASKLVQLVRDELDEGQVSNLATDKIASPVLQVCLHFLVQSAILTDCGLLCRSYWKSKLNQMSAMPQAH